MQSSFHNWSKGILSAMLAYQQRIHYLDQAGLQVVGWAASDLASRRAQSAAAGTTALVKSLPQAGALQHVCAASICLSNESSLAVQGAALPQGMSHVSSSHLQVPAVGGLCVGLRGEAVIVPCILCLASPPTNPPFSTQFSTNPTRHPAPLHMMTPKANTSAAAVERCMLSTSGASHRGLLAPPAVLVVRLLSRAVPSRMRLRLKSATCTHCVGEGMCAV
jgi:hypothetical protein